MKKNTLLVILALFFMGMVSIACENSEEEDDWKSVRYDWEKVGELPYKMWAHKMINATRGLLISYVDKIFTSDYLNHKLEWNLIPDTVLLVDHQIILFHDSIFTIGGFTLNDNGWKIDNVISHTNENYFRSDNINNYVNSIVPQVNGLTGGIVQHVGLAFNNAMWVIGGITDSGYNNKKTENAIWRSTDGVNWIKQKTTGFTARASHAGVVFDNKIYISGGFGDGGREHKSDVLVSSDGVTWETLTTNPGWSKRSDHTLVANSEGLWLIGGYDGKNFLNDVWFSSDGIKWIKPLGTPPFAPRAGHSAYFDGPSLYISGGVNGNWDNELNDVWKLVTYGNEIKTRYAPLNPTRFRITNNSNYPIKYAYIDGGSNILNTEIPVNGTPYETELEIGIYELLVYDTQNRYQKFTVNIRNNITVTHTVTSNGWITPPVLPVFYNFSIKNDYSYAVDSVFIRKFGAAEWGHNLLDNPIAYNASHSLGVFELGQYEIKMVSKDALTTVLRYGVAPRSGADRSGASMGKNLEGYKTVYNYSSFTLASNTVLSAPASTLNWENTDR